MLTTVQKIFGSSTEPNRTDFEYVEHTPLLRDVVLEWEDGTSEVVEDSLSTFVDEERNTLTVIEDYEPNPYYSSLLECVSVSTDAGEKRNINLSFVKEFRIVEKEPEREMYLAEVDYSGERPEVVDFILLEEDCGDLDSCDCCNSDEVIGEAETSSNGEGELQIRV